jgi:hypothetical protein
LKDKIIHLFREQTSSEALATFTSASCAETIPLRSHCLLSLFELNFEILKRPDLNANEEHVLDLYKWLHPDCTPPPTTFDEGALHDILVDPEGVSWRNRGAFKWQTF